MSCVYDFNSKNFNIETYLQTRRQQVEEALSSALQPVYPGAERLFAAMDYSLLAGGKRLRPLLFLAALEGFNKGFADNSTADEPDLSAFLPFACGIEMLQTYSLIHDDLPAMDDDDLRRGRPSCHKAFDEATAILAGDGLLTHCFAMLLSVPADSHALVKAVRYFAEKTGIYGMVAGQCLDIQAEGQPITVEELRQIHQAKTAALLQASVVCGGLLGGADDDEAAALAEFGRQFGLAFQIVDDILDEVGDAAVLGKPVGSDAANNKTTYVSLLSLDGAKQAAAEATQAAVAALAPLGDKGRLLTALADYYLNRNF
ncbi:MAG: polyprenyl synthetase family protein [Firmicutes bacterium]|nr:polyprenyl synthetase family protein [Bacillota bacterium]MBQ3199531.1 polyprenyl synthetase family protein [Bacillota bacterium]